MRTALDGITAGEGVQSATYFDDPSPRLKKAKLKISLPAETLAIITNGDGKE